MILNRLIVLGWLFDLLLHTRILNKLCVFFCYPSVCFHRFNFDVRLRKASSKFRIVGVAVVAATKVASIKHSIQVVQINMKDLMRFRFHSISIQWQMVWFPHFMIIITYLMNEFIEIISIWVDKSTNKWAFQKIIAIDQYLHGIIHCRLIFRN